MEAHINEWLNLLIRWLHMIVGIAWIGASFYFNWLENKLNRIGQREGIAGSLWAIHGGGFYYLEKYKVAPQQIPETLHWFKYEAYFTWLSGMALLVVVYYMNAGLFLVDPSLWNVSSEVAIAAALGFLVLGWIIYDQLCKSRLGQNNQALALVGFALVVIADYALCKLFAARAAYIHVGALLGTCMVANVFFVIIPGQKAMVDAAKANQTPDPEKGAKALQRSRHNNYITLPVLFVMISNHFPSTFGHEHQWLILAGMILVGVAIRHWFNLRGMGQANHWLLPASAVGLVVLFFATSPMNFLQERTEEAEQVEVNYAEALQIINTRCVSCHSQRPTDEIFKVAPLGVMFDDPEKISLWGEKIKIRVENRTMPFANKTQMTDLERRKLIAWIDAGAPTQ